MTRKSILYRLVSWYAGVLLLVGLGIGAIYYQLYVLRQATRKQVAQYRSVQSTALRVEAELNYVAYLGYNYLLLDYKSIAARAKGIWEERLEVYMDSLSTLVQQIPDTEAQERVKNVRRDLLMLQEHWELFFQYAFSIPRKEDKQLIRIDKDFDLRLNKIRLELLNVSISQESNLKFALQEVELSAQKARDWSLITVLLAFLTSLAITYLLIRRLLHEQKNMQEYTSTLLDGDFPTPLPETFKETKQLRHNLIKLRESFSNLKELAEEVGTGNFDSQINVFTDKGTLGKALAGMRQSLQQIATENRQRNWFNEGYAQFTEILRNSQQENRDFYEAVLSYLVKYLDIQQGGLFVLEDSKANPLLVLKAAYAFGRSKYPEKSFKYGEGLVGEVWREGTLKILTDIPENYVDITSGLGKSKPKYIILAPLFTTQEFVGVLELAGFQALDSYQVDFIKRVAESISATIARLKTDAETQTLLTDTQVMAEKMVAQEEENRQNLEALMLAQTKLEQNAAEMQAQLIALDNAFVRMELDRQGHFTRVNDLMLKTTGYQANEILNKHFTILLGPRKDDKNVLNDWNSVLAGQFVKGEFIRYDKKGNKFWIYEVIYPIFNQQNMIESIQIVGYDITKQKEQEFKIKEQLNELQMSKRDVINRIREVEGKARIRMEKMKLDFLEQLQEKERIIGELKSD